MRRRCNYCDGKGYLMPMGALSLVVSGNDPCPACNGAGELEDNIDPNLKAECKLCGGKGFTVDILGGLNGKKLCDNCKGLGYVEIRSVGSSNQKISQNEITNPQAPRPATYEYDVAVSFAGENRDIVEKYVKLLEPLLNVFYDENEQVDLWGSDLLDKLDEIYRKKALCCVVFISEKYAENVWTNYEIKKARARALKSLKDNIEYILPVKLDNTEIPEISNTIGYIDFSKKDVGELAIITIKKVEKLKEKYGIK